MRKGHVFARGEKQFKNGRVPFDKFFGSCGEVKMGFQMGNSGEGYRLGGL